jgi:hypothetical protein
MLLQPEPEYAFARMVFMGWAQAELAAAGMIGVSAERAAPDHGAPIPPLSGEQLVLNDSVRGDAIIVDPSLFADDAAAVGHSLRFNRPAFTNTTYTEASRQIDGISNITTTGVTFSAEQVSITTKLVGGPYDAANSRIAPFPVAIFDAQRSIHSLAQYVGLQLMRDRMKYLDAVMGGYYCGGGANTRYPGDPSNTLSSVDTAFAAAGDRPMDVETIFRAEEKLQTLNVPRFSNGKYMLFLHPVQVRQLRSDPELSRNAVFQVDKNPLSQSFIATIGTGVEVYVSTTVPSTTNSGTITYYKGSMFGPGAVGYAPSMKCHVRAANEDNFGLTPKVIWVAGEGHSILDNRFIVNLYSD